MIHIFDKLSKWFLDRNGTMILLLSFLILPFFIWLFSIGHRLSKNRNATLAAFFFLLAVYVSSTFTFIYLTKLELFQIEYSISSGNLMLVMITAILSGQILLIRTVYVFYKFEKNTKLPTIGLLKFLIFMGTFVLTIFEFQKILHAYSNEVQLQLTPHKSNSASVLHV